MKAVIYYIGTPFSKQHGHRVSFKNISEHMRLKEMGIKKPGKKFFYSTGDYEGFKEDLGWSAVAQLRRQNWVFVEKDPVWISVIFAYKSNLGDNSNLIGGIEDALNGIAWTDDCQAIINKVYGVINPELETPRITIILENFDGSEIKVSEGITAWVADGLNRRLKKQKKKGAR